MCASLYLKNSFNHTLMELNEEESRICFGISFQVLAPWYPKDFLLHSRRSRGVSKSSSFLVIYFEIFELGVNLFLRFSGQTLLFTLYVVISLSYFIRFCTLSQSHTQPSLCFAHSIILRALKEASAPPLWGAGEQRCPLKQTFNFFTYP